MKETLILVNRFVTKIEIDSSSLDPISELIEVFVKVNYIVKYKVATLQSTKSVKEINFAKEKIFQIDAVSKIDILKYGNLQSAENKKADIRNPL